MPDPARHPADMTLEQFLAEFDGATPELHRELVEDRQRKKAAEEVALKAFKREG